jgi:putative sterol carrier protein
MALVGLMNTLNVEGRKYNIHVNTVAPLAASRLTEDVMPPDMFEKARPEFVVPIVAYLCSDECTESGAIFNAGMGYFNRAAIFTGSGTQIGDVDNPPSVEQIEANWEAINTISGTKELADVNAAFMDLITPAPVETREKADTPAADKPDVQAIFDNMATTFKADAAAGVAVVFQFTITGPGGGDWNCEIKDQACAINGGTHAKPACTLKMSAVDFADMMTGKLPAMQAFTSGKLIIEGDVMKSQLIEKLFSI